jgi:hypothetical protein
MAFSILISNTDDHLRNHGFLHEWASRGRCRLHLTSVPTLNEAQQPVTGVNDAAGELDEKRPG